MTYNISSGAVSTFAVNGTIVGISPNGGYLLFSDSVGNAVYAFYLGTQTVVYTSGGHTTASAAYTPDSKYNQWLDGTQLLYGLPNVTPASLTLPYTSNALDFIAEGGLTYITSSSNGEIDVRSTCDRSEERRVGKERRSRGAPE